MMKIIFPGKNIRKGEPDNNKPDNNEKLTGKAETEASDFANAAASGSANAAASDSANAAASDFAEAKSGQTLNENADSSLELCKTGEGFSGSVSQGEADQSQCVKNPETSEKKKALLPPREEFAVRISKFEEYYLQLLVSLAAIVLLSLVVAIHANLWIGVSVFLLTGVIYVYFTSDELIKKLGIIYKSVKGGVVIEKARVRYGDEYFVPSKLIFLDVIKIESGAFASEKNAGLREVHLPETLVYIGKDIFDKCGALETIYFEGTQEEFGKIVSETDFSAYGIIFNDVYPKYEKPPKAAKVTPHHVERDNESEKSDTESVTASDFENKNADCLKNDGEYGINGKSGGDSDHGGDTE